MPAARRVWPATGQGALAADRAQARLDRAGSARAACRISRGTPTTSTRSNRFPRSTTTARGTRLELGDYDAARNDDKFKLRAFGDARRADRDALCRCLPVEERGDGKYFITMVNRLNAQDPNSPAHLEIKLLYGGAVHDQRYIVSVPPGLGDRQGWYTVLRYNMTGRDNRLHRERRVWHDYKFYMWWSAGGDGQLRHVRRCADGAAGQHQCRADHVRRLPSDGLGAISGQGDRPVSRAGGQRSRRRHEHRRRSRAGRDQRRLRKLSRSGIGARGQRRPFPLHRQPAAALGRAVQRGLWPVPRPKAGVSADRPSATRKRSARPESSRGPESAATS